MEIKNSLEGIHNKFEQMEEKTRKLKNKSIEMILCEEQKKINEEK